LWCAAILIWASVIFNNCHKSKTITVHSEKTYLDTAELNHYKREVKKVRDSIKSIKGKFVIQYIEVAKSHRPDTFIRNLTDTVFGNHDSFIYVTVLKGRECCAEIPWKDSIINLDSVMMERSEANLRKCDKKVKSFKVWQRILIGLSFVLGGALVVK